VETVARHENEFEKFYHTSSRLVIVLTELPQRVDDLLQVSNGSALNLYSEGTRFLNLPRPD
jgi:hypothetical protein